MSFLNINVVVALACWSVWGILDKKALEHSTHLGIAFRLYSMALWQLPLIYCILHVTQPGFSIQPEAWMWTGLAAIFQVISLFAYLAAMSITDASLVLGATAAYPVITQFLAVLFLGEKLLPLRTLGSAAIAAGVISIGLTVDHSEKRLARWEAWMLIATIAVATFCWGIWGVFDKKAIEHGTPLEIWLAECVWDLTIVTFASLAVIAIKRKVELTDRQGWLFTTLSAVALAVGRLAFLYALSIADASYVIAITGCYPLFMYVLALLFLKERFNKARLAGIFLIVAGGAAVQYSL